MIFVFAQAPTHSFGKRGQYKAYKVDDTSDEDSGEDSDADVSKIVLYIF